MSDNERIIKFILDIANCYELSPQDYNEAKLLLDKYGSMTCDKQETKCKIEQNKVGHGGGGVRLESKVKEDSVNNPKHYMLFADGMESFDVIRKTLTREEYIGFLKGNILKYRLRAGKKGEASTCIDKSDWYAQKLTESVESMKGDDND